MMNETVKEKIKTDTTENWQYPGFENIVISLECNIKTAFWNTISKHEICSYKTQCYKNWCTSDN